MRVCTIFTLLVMLSVTAAAQSALAEVLTKDVEATVTYVSKSNPFKVSVGDKADIRAVYDTADSDYSQNGYVNIAKNKSIASLTFTLGQATFTESDDVGYADEFLFGPIVYFSGHGNISGLSFSTYSKYFGGSTEYSLTFTNKTGFFIKNTTDDEVVVRGSLPAGGVEQIAVRTLLF